jgi:transcriptional regulator with XRE-family HTH domain
MSLTTAEAEQIAGKIQAALEMKGLTAAELARAASIDPSRLSRILRGSFSTLNPVVMQICNYLGVLPGGTEQQSDGPSRICASALQIWDGTAEDAEDVVNFLEQIALLRRRR